MSEYPYAHVMPMDEDEWSIVEWANSLDDDDPEDDDPIGSGRIEHFLRVSAALQAGEETLSPLPMPPGGGRPGLGGAAYDTLEELCEVPHWTEEKRWWWTLSDITTLHNWYNIEGHRPAAQAEMGTEVEDLNEVLLRLHGAMPFDEVERDWLFEAHDETQGPNSITLIRRREATIVSGGLRRVVQGRDLIRRWWSWRRETDEFSGQGSLDQARDALRDLVVAHCDDPELPESYLALRRDQPTASP